MNTDMNVKKAKLGAARGSLGSPPACNYCTYCYVSNSNMHVLSVCTDVYMTVYMFIFVIDHHVFKIDHMSKRAFSVIITRHKEDSGEE